MKTLWKIFAALAAVVVGLVLWLCNKAGGMPLSALFLDAFVISQLVEILLVLGLVVAAALPNGRGQVAGFLKVWLWLLLGLGALGTLRSLSTTLRAMQDTHTTNLMVIAPSLAEGLVPLGLGLLAAAICAFKLASARKPSPAGQFD